jgi:catalase
MFDAVYIPGGDKSVKALMDETDAVQFVSEAYKHCKTIATTGAGVDLVRGSCLKANELSNGKAKGDKLTDPGVITTPDVQADKIASAFIKAIAQHRHWRRETNPVPA